MASDSKQSKYLTVYLHYNGLFAPKPLVYLNAVVVSICDVDFGAMDFKDFNLFIAKLIEGSCDNVYYCTRNEPLAEGIRRISNDADYFEFIETGYSDEAGLRMNVYIDHENEPVLDWADDEGHYFDEDLDDDKDSQLSDDIPYEHEADDYIPSFDKTIGDEFLHRVSGMCKDINDEAETDEVETKNGDDKPVYPVHNENQKWDKMVPILGMRFSNPMELKNCLTNYAVKNGYNLYFEKNDSQRGQLLAAMGRDANNHIFPIAWAVVEVENKETWKWFLDLLLDDIEMGIGHGLTLISDQHKGLIEAVKERVPAAEHRQCARHIYANFKKSFKGEQYRKLFWAAAASTTQPKFEAEMNSIKKIDPLAYEHLMERDPKSWCRAFFEVDRACDAYENGISESFNSVIDLARKRPLITMLEEIRIYAMERMYKMLQEGQSWGNLKICPSIRLKISKLKKQQRFWGVIPSGIQQYEVRIGNDGYAVDLNNNTCGCRSWQVSGIPCVHAVAAISYLNRNAEDYVAPWFHTAMFLTCYNHTINPLNGSSMWPEAPYMKPLPPQKRRLPGRPTLKRKKDQSEMESKGKTRHTISKAGSVNRCSICRERGHNRSTCPTRLADVASTSRPKNKKPKKCKKEKGKVEPVQVDPVQADLVDPVQVPAPQVDPVQADPVDPVDDPHPDVDVPAQPVATRQRIRKYSERITKIGLRRKVLKKEGSTGHNPMVLE
ncbi:unnamed protein product [Lactuca saligna]|uniref:SWIM-type domain-containing protein n=1 Tax=Lactuca saligna TaxID=75948 RepID=A0AA36E0T7_LACSI|nr:unnamed protein product [Lactuca saligna]